MNFIRVDILLPTYDNDKYPVETEKFIQTLDELFDRFKGGNLDYTPIMGKWEDPKTHEVFLDENMTYWVICEDSLDNIRFLKEEYEPKLRKRFKQRAMMIYYWNDKML